MKLKFPMGCFNRHTFSSTGQNSCIELKDKKVNVADLSSGFVSDGTTYFSSFASIDFWFQTKVWLDHYCHKNVQRGEKSTYTFHFFYR